jgi:large subunit ribosomal protein L2
MIEKKLLTPNKTHLIKKKPLIKKLISGIKNSSGRNNSGKITVRHKGHGHKQKYRTINFQRYSDFNGIVTSIEYDPIRNANIASLYEFSSKLFCYILSPKNLKIGDIVKTGKNLQVKLGYSMPLRTIPAGSFVYNVTTSNLTHAKFTRAAGTFSKIKEKNFHFAKIELNSGTTKQISVDCFATIGIVSNEWNFLKHLGKAGRARWLNIRPTVRGVAMNPVDHPHGGGEGKKSGSGKTPWGKPTKKAKLNK